ncbi:DNA (cytosine-5-)-methyltransferase [Bacillus phage vB_BceS_LY1]|uniref:Cytosine-specific methyltransferase n=1 Tax=Bacillus phage vB_BceS_LY1 TaxID=2950459 RepID=A0AAE9S1P8_9CAUD|nr:DNA (cytosine-5-)-methyltransferase [Bacillus phage vB_BceS_LY1]
MDELKVFEAFAGVGTQSMALERLGVNYKVVGVAEIDPYAIISYAVIRDVDVDEQMDLEYDDMYFDLELKNIGYDFKKKRIVLPKSKKELMRIYVADKAINNFGDVSLLNPEELPDFDLFTYSFPCQDLSISGKQEGLKEGTRSGQLYECEKIIAYKKPEYLMLENVKNLVQKKHKPDFDRWVEWLDGQGYYTPWKVLNAKDYGIPQNRERVFAISMRGEDAYTFPDNKDDISIIKHEVQQEVTVRKYPVDVDKLKVVLSEAKRASGMSIKEIAEFVEVPKTKAEHWFRKDGSFSIPDPEVWDVLKLALDIWTDEFDESITTFEKRNGVYEKSNRVYDVSGIAPTITTGKGELILDYDFPEPYPLTVKLKDLLETEVDEKYYLGMDFTPETSKGDSDLQMVGRVDINGHDQVKRVYSPEGVSPALTTMQGGHRHPKVIEYVNGEIRVKEATKLGYKVAEVGDSINILYPSSTTRRGRVGKQVAQTLQSSAENQVAVVAMRGRYNDDGKIEQKLEQRKDEVTNTITTVTKDNLVATPPGFRIRRLTPLECWRLMGIDDELFYKVKNAGMSDAQLYKQAGNAIVVDVMVELFRRLFNE